MQRNKWICDGRRCIRRRTSCDMQHESGNGHRCCTSQDRATTKAGRQSLRQQSQQYTRVLIRVQRSIRRASMQPARDIIQQRACNLKHTTSYDVQACNAAAPHGPADSHRTALPCLLLAIDLERPFTTAAPSGAFGSFVFSGECADAAEARGPPAFAAALRHLRRVCADQRHICTRTWRAWRCVCP
jgi:hypothetical protein